MTNKLVVIINGLKVPKIKKILLYEMKYLVPNYSCLQNPWLGGCRPQVLVLSVLCPQLNLLNSPRKKFLDTPLSLVTIALRCTYKYSTSRNWVDAPWMYNVPNTNTAIVVFFLLPADGQDYCFHRSIKIYIKIKISSNVFRCDHHHQGAYCVSLLKLQC